MQYSPGAKAIIDLLRFNQDHAVIAGGTIWWDVLIRELLNGLSPTEAELPLVLGSESVWPTSRRIAFTSNPVAQSRSGLSYLQLVTEMCDLAESEGAPLVTEWHIAKLTCARAPAEFQRAGIDTAALLRCLGEKEGRMVLSPSDRLKTWAFCDTTLFEQFQFFTEVEWNGKLGISDVVLVVPPVVIGELDSHRADPVRQRERRRDRAKKVIRRFWEITGGASPTVPARLRDGVELLLQGREPIAFPDGLDPLLADDRLIAAAIEFRWTHFESKVVVLTGDLSVAVKARTRGIDAPDLYLTIAPAYSDMSEGDS